VATQSLQLVEEVVERRDALLQTLAFSRVRDDSRRLGRRLERVSRQHLPVIKDALRECLAASVGAQVSSETYNTVTNNITCTCTVMTYTHNL